MQALEAIDQGGFERIATAYLRRDPRLANAIHHGVNWALKAVSDPVDATSVTTVGGRRWYSYVFHSTEKLGNLSGKWFGTKGKNPKEGDLERGLRYATEVRLHDSSANILVVLTTNRRPRQSELGKARSLADAASVDLDIVEQSRLTDYLDLDREGQWFRKELGIAPQMLSRELLCDIMARNVRDYERDFFITRADLVKREINDRIAATLSATRRGVVFVVADPGMGKTAVALQQIADHTQFGGVALRLRPDVVRGALNLEEALRAVLLRYEPALDDHCGIDTLNLTRHDGVPLLLVIDDVNLSVDTDRIVEQVASFGNDDGTNATSASQAPHTAAVLLVPIWPRTADSLSDGARRRSEIVTIGTYGDEEAAEAVVRVMRLEGAERAHAPEIARTLRNDPLLIGLLTGMSSESALLAVHGDVVVENYVNEAVRKVATNYGLTPGEARDAAVEIARVVIETADPTPPTLMLLTVNPTSSSVGVALRAFLTDRRIVGIIYGGDQERLTFRHDRVRDVLLKWFFLQALRDGKDIDALADPFYSQSAGRALAEYGVVELKVLHRIALDAPVALAYAAQSACGAGHRPPDSLVNKLQDIIDGGRPSRPIPAYQELRTVLSRIDSDIVLDLTKNRSSAYPYARLRRGDVSQAIAVGAALANYRYIEATAVLSEALHADGQRLISEITSALLSKDQHRRFAALSLARYLGELIRPAEILGAYSTTADPNALLPIALAAMIMHPTPTQQGLQSLIDSVAALPVGQERQRVCEAVSNLLDWASPVAITHLTSAADPDRRSDALIILSNVDNPEVVSFWLRTIGTAQASLPAETLGYIPMAHHYARDWASRMSPAFRKAVEELWRSRTENLWTRRFALDVWSFRRDQRDLQLLQTVGDDDPLIDDVLRRRMAVRDESAYAVLLKRLDGANPDFWITEMSAYWRAELTRSALRIFRHVLQSEMDNNRRSNARWALAKLLTEIDERDAEALFRAVGAEVGFEFFVPAAISIGTPWCIAWAEREIGSAPSPEVALDHLGAFYGLRTSDGTVQIDAAKLRRLEPYLPHLSFLEIHDAFEAATRLRLLDWRDSYLAPLLPEGERHRIAPSPRDLDRELDLLTIPEVNLKLPTTFFIMQFEMRGSTIEAGIAHVLDWQARRGTEASYLVAIDALEAYGTRADICLLAERAPRVLPEVVGLSFSHARYSIRRRTLR